MIYYTAVQYIKNLQILKFYFPTVQYFLFE